MFSFGNACILGNESGLANIDGLLSDSLHYLDEKIDLLTKKCVEELKSQGFEE